MGNWQSTAGGAGGAVIGTAVAGPVGGMVGGYLGSTIGGMFGKKKKGIEPRPDYPYMSAGNLYNWAQDYQKRYPYDPAKPYFGELNAPMTGMENYAQGMLGDYMQTPTASSLNSANKYNTDVLQGGYDPRTSPYYTAMKSQILKDAGEAGAAVRHSAASSGMLHSDPRHIQERKLSENVSDQLATLLGSMYESERGRMTTAAGQAPGIAQMMSQLPLQKITAGSTIGAMPREVAQAGMGRDYQEYMRQLAGAREPLNIYESLSGKSYNPYPAQTYYPGQSSGSGSDMGQMLMKLLPYLIAA